MQASLERLDPVMDRILFVSSQPALNHDQEARTAENILSFPLLFSGVRCVIQYAVLPFLLPAIGIATNAGVAILLVINIAAMISVVFSLRRFWKIRYSHRWAYFFVATFALGLLTLFLYLDLRALDIVA